jgi:sugar (pentulose or hexulose) kinase
MTEQKLIGVHLGTSNVAVTVYNQDGTVLNHGESSIEKQTTVAWERAFYEATPSLPDDAICSVAGTSGTILLVDKYGEPVFSPQMYYESAPEEADQLTESNVEEQSINMDIITSPTAPLAKILRIREQHPSGAAS